MSGPRLGMSQMNGNNRRPPNISRMNSNDSSNNRDRGDRGAMGAAAALPLSIGVAASASGSASSAPSTQHDELIKYIYDSWSKVESGSSSGSVNYYQEQENHLKDFQPFDLDAYYERRLIQNEQQPQHS